MNIAMQQQQQMQQMQTQRKRQFLSGVANVMQLPTSNPTSVAFGGADGGDLYITTSWVDCERPGDEPLAGAIFRCRPGATGLPSPRFTDLPQRIEKGIKE